MAVETSDRELDLLKVTDGETLLIHGRGRWVPRGPARTQCNVLLRRRDTYGYAFVDRLYGSTALRSW